MTTVSENDLKELRALILETNSRLETKLNELDKRIIELSGEIRANNIKIDALDKKFSDGLSALDKRIGDGLGNLDKRVSNQEFIYRAVVIGVISLLITPFVATAIKYFMEHPLIPLS